MKMFAKMLEFLESLERKREVKYGPPPYSFYRKDWKLPPQMPIPVIVSKNRYVPRRSFGDRTSINKNLIQLFPPKQVSQPGESQVDYSSRMKREEMNSRPWYKYNRRQFENPRRLDQFLPWKSNRRGIRKWDDLQEAYVSAAHYEELFEWFPCPIDCVPVAE